MYCAYLTLAAIYTKGGSLKRFCLRRHRLEVALSRRGGDGDASGGDAANQKIQLRDGEHALILVEVQVTGGEDGEHALLLVEGQVAGGEDGEQRAELGRRRQYLSLGYAGSGYAVA
jgi:hypothetical protein